MNTIPFLKSLQDPSGGFHGWPDGPLYPEITGYLIPTLLQWEESEMAKRAADWLVEVQGIDGSWKGVYGNPAAFDTAACIEGLRSMPDKPPHYFDSIRLGITWLYTQKLSELYHLRVSGVLGSAFYVQPVCTPETRTHYWAYALEGLYMLGKNGEVQYELGKLKRGLQPRTLDGKGSDTCATAQVAKLRFLVGLDTEEELSVLRSLVNPDGSLPHDLDNPKKVAWACKYYLDVEYLHSNK